jgi:4-diphosphocytidyl-2-C-methyl-D-erythritol kinase
LTAGTRRVRLDAPAKLNLGLRVLGLRSDGFHEIRSVFHTVSLCDDLELRVGPGSGIGLECTGDEGVPDGPSNLAWRAAEAFMDAAGLGLRVCIRLAKRIPSAAGLGGGSSDAAAVLRGLARATGCDPGLAGLAAELGSDVPFFLHGGAAFVSGRGEVIEPIEPLDFHAVLLHPGVAVSTAWAYRELDRAPDALTNPCEDNSYCAPAEERHEGKPFPFQLDNDFLPLLVREFEQLGAVKGFLEDRCHSWGLSGSGPTFYALFGSRGEAEAFACDARVWAEGRPGALGCTVCESADSAGA